MSDPAQLLVDHLDIWTGAIERKSGSGRGNGGKISLYGIDKLRSLILDLAVRGKLVPQDPADGDAGELLKRVYRERKQLIAAKKLSKPKAIRSERSMLEAIEAPSSWARDFFGNVFSLEYGDNLPERARSQTGEFPVYGSNGVVGSHSEYCVASPCIVVGRKGSAGAVNRCDEPACWVTDVAFYCVPPVGVDLRFVEILFITLNLDDLGKGIKPGLNRNEANALPVALPPLAEQKRIVAKVDELMALVDALEAGTRAGMEAHETLVRELLATLVNSQDAEDLARNWSRIETHFDTLFTTEDSIDALKQTIVDLAVGGKFSAGQALHWPHHLLGDFVAEVSAGWSPKCIETPRSDEKWGVLKVSAVTWGEFRPDENKELPENLEPRPEIEVRPGDFLISRANTSDLVARSVVVPADAPSKLMMSDKIIRFRFKPELHADFVNLIHDASYAREYYAAVAGGTSSSMKNVSQAQIRNLQIPVPPLVEQRRIVSIVESFTHLCEKSKAVIRRGADRAMDLANALTNTSAA